jgi:hypothetical protein
LEKQMNWKTLVTPLDAHPELVRASRGSNAKTPQQKLAASIDTQIAFASNKKPAKGKQTFTLEGDKALLTVRYGNASLVFWPDKQGRTKAETKRLQTTLVVPKGDLLKSLNELKTAALAGGLDEQLAPALAMIEGRTAKMQATRAIKGKKK